MKIPRIAVIIAAKNSSPTIRKCVDSALGLKYANFEVVVVDDGSSDDTPAILAGYGPGIKVITTKGIGPSAARNLAARQVAADYVAFTDSDCIVDSRWLDELVKGFAAGGVAASGGRQDVPDDESAFGMLVYRFMKKAGIISDYVRSGEGGIIPVSHNPSCNVMYERGLYLENGGFLEDLWPGEDLEFDYRLKRQGKVIMWNPGAVVYHYKPRTLRAFAKMMYRYGYVQGLLVRMYGIFRRVQAVPIALALVLISAAAGLLLGYFIPVAAAAAVSSLLFIAYLGFDPALAGIFITAMAVWHLGFIKGLLRLP